MARKLPKWKHPKAAERDYIRSLQHLADDVATAVRANVYPVLALFRADAVEDEPASSGWTEELRQAFVAASAEVSVAAYVEAMRKFGDQASRYNKMQFQRILRAGYGVDVFADEPWLADTMSQWEAQNVKLIKSIPAQALDRMHGKVTAAVRQGKTSRDLQKILIDEFGITKRRAALIGDDQIGKLNGQLTKERQTGIGVESYRWRGVLDRRERDAHVAREGVRFKWSSPPADGNPGEPVRCFPGSLELDASPIVRKVYRRAYSGELRELVFDDGVILPVTPNHPIFTPEGIRPSHSIDVGDDVIKAFRQGSWAVKDNGKHPVTTFEQVFRSLLLCGIRVDVTAGGSGQFHGDGSDNEVSIVSTDSLLRGELDRVIVEKVRKLGFTYADMAWCRSLLSGIGSVDTFGFGVGDSGNSIVGRLHLMISLLLRHLRPFEFLRFALSTNGGSGLNKYSTDDGAADSESFGDCILAFSCLIHGPDAIHRKINSVGSRPMLAGGSVFSDSSKFSTDDISTKTDDWGHFVESHPGIKQTSRVVEVRSREYLGRVYNLETVTGNYSAAGILVGNCRCWGEPILPSLADVKGTVSPLPERGFSQTTRGLL